MTTVNMEGEFEPSDEGMAVKTTSGEEIGRVDAVWGDIAHVRPDPDFSTSIRQRLGWTTDHPTVFEIRHSSVAEFTDEAIVIEY